MALLHVATLTPTKAELIAQWAPTQIWGPPASAALDVIGSYRFDDPEGRVGLEAHLVSTTDAVIQIPLSYRDQPLDGAEEALIAKMEHSVLGTRWVYDGLRDPLLVTMLTAVALTGQGEALSMAEHEGRLYVSPSNVRIQGGGWTRGGAALDGFELVSDEVTVSILRNDRFELTVFRRPVFGPRPPIGLTATWDGRQDAVILAEVQER